MTLADLPILAPSPGLTAADALAARTFENNRAALFRTQPRLAAALEDIVPGVTWVFARDGSLTFRDHAGRWWAGCSLPRRAGAAMLRRLEVPGVVGCLLAPGHAGEILAALDKLAATQAVIVLHPDLTSLKVALTCGDLAADIAAHRLWFAWGQSWETEFARLFDEQPGLPTPERFIRTPALAEDLAAELIPAAEAVLAGVGSRRAARVAELRATPSNRESQKCLVVASSRFRLWDDAGPALAGALGAADGDAVTRLDPDDPASTSAWGLALAAHDATAVISAGSSRAQLPGVIPAACAVLTWVTTPAIPPADANFPADGLILADETWLSRARAAGWEQDRLRVAAWPTAVRGPCAAAGCPKTIALIADTRPLDTPVAELDLSSHHMLWEAIRGELLDDPFRLGSDVGGYLERRRAAMGIAEDGFAAAWLMERLVLPAYQQGLARVLLAAGLPLKISGSFWGDVSEFRDAWAGPLVTREAFDAAVGSSAALIYPWPARHAHAIDTLGRPVVTPGRRANTFLRDAKAALAGEKPSLAAHGSASLREAVDSLLAR